VRHTRTAVALTGILLIAACSGSDSGPSDPSPTDGVRIASADFDESALLAELYALALEDAGVPVVRLGRVGPREVVAPALELDQIDLVPEYLGTALEFFGALTTSSDTRASKETLVELLAPRGLIVLEAAAAQDANAFVTTRTLATELSLTRISDLSPHASTLSFGGPVECPDRPLCLAGLEDVYGLQFAEFVPQASLVVTAEALRRDEIDVGLLFTTAAEADDPELVVLEDDLGLQPAENVIPLTRQSAVDAWGSQMVDALNAVSSALTTDGLREMNRLVSEGASITDVASSWLISQGLAVPD
jgi:osmoprotectant transport system substrate-binding protein